MLRFETVDATGGVDCPVGTGIEWVTIAADFYRKLLFGGSNGKNGPASAGRFGVGKVFRVDVLFHCNTNYESVRIYE